MRTEKIIAFIIFIGLLFKFVFLWPGGNPILVIALSTLSLLYFPFAFYFFSNKGISNQNIALSISGGIFMSAAVMGILFKLLYWPGGEEMLQVSILPCMAILALSFILGRNKKSSTTENQIFDNSLSSNILDLPANKEDASKASNMKGYYKSLRFRGIVISFLTLLLYITPKASLIRLQHWNDPEEARLKIRMYDNPDNKDYKEEYMKYLLEKDKK